jgi:hypothetical protein
MFKTRIEILGDFLGLMAIAAFAITLPVGNDRLGASLTKEPRSMN